MDYTQTLTLLKVNGVSLDSFPEDIKAVLLQVKYSEADIEKFLSMLAESKAHPDESPPVEVASSTIPGTPLETTQIGSPDGTQAPISAPTPASIPVSTPTPPPTASVAPVPAPAPTPTPQSMPSVGVVMPVSVSPAKKSKKVLFIALGLVAIIPICFGGYVAYAMYGVSPEVGVLGAMKNSVDVKIFHMDIDIHNTSTAKDKQMSIKIGADVDATDANLMKVALKPEVDSSLMSGSGEIRVINKTLYGKLTSLSFLGMSAGDTFANVWYKVTEDDVKSLAGDMPGVNIDQLSQSTDKNTAEKKMASLFDSGALTPTGAPQLSFIDGRPVLKYSFVIHEDKLKEWRDANAMSSSTPESPFASKVKIAYSPIVFVKDFASGTLKSVEGSVTATSTSMFGGNETADTYVYHVEYFPLTSVAIEEPKDAKSLASLFEDARSKGEDAMIKSNLDMMRAAGELYYDAHKNSYGVLSSSTSCVDAKTSLFSDPVMKSAFRQIKTEETCRTSKDGQSYAVSAKLVSKPNTWFCVDSTGASKETPENTISAPGSVSC